MSSSTAPGPPSLLRCRVTVSRQRSAGAIRPAQTSPLSASQGPQEEQTARDAIRDVIDGLRVCGAALRSPRALGDDTSTHRHDEHVVEIQTARGDPQKPTGAAGARSY
ncbi:hypothetical protein THAOC_33537 [Thalassiosira oceanica]|uniref:Uncharacterized protein n=1 Tax=Thalassiosira oceanica TaxID=159749 RepID=K0R508_THAOC|nr:hypothetical protein THAOC_33537 [Thalassiosira oceanica]|eukprot:EJK47725.1 hypothetical protein THAOC_33537 [Thalassiosira oceanica]